MTYSHIKNAAMIYFVDGSCFTDHLVCKKHCKNHVVYIVVENGSLISVKAEVCLQPC